MKRLIATVATLAISSLYFLTGTAAHADARFFISRCIVPGTAEALKGGGSSSIAGGLGTGIDVGPDGSVWFTRPDSYIGRLYPNGRLAKVKIPKRGKAISLSFDRSGKNLWIGYKKGRKGYVAVRTPKGNWSSYLAPYRTWSWTPASIVPTDSEDMMVFSPLPGYAVRFSPSGESDWLPITGQFNDADAGLNGTLWLSDYASLSRIGVRWSESDGTMPIRGFGVTVNQTVAADTRGNGWFFHGKKFDPPGKRMTAIRSQVTRVSSSGDKKEFVLGGSLDHNAADIASSPDGSLWASTFAGYQEETAIWHIKPDGRSQRIVIRDRKRQILTGNLGAVATSPDSSAWIIDKSTGAIIKIAKSRRSMLTGRTCSRL